MMQRLVTERMVEMVFAPLDEVAAWANRIGLESHNRQAEGVVILINPYLNFRTAILENSDPITRSVSLASAIGGALWPRIFPDLLEAVNREWKIRAKEASRPRPENGG